MSAIRSILCGLALLVGCDAAWAQGAQIAPDFRGKTITVLVGFEAGGAYDIYARLYARYLSAHLPGQPRVVVQNMPGAGGLNAANTLYNVSPHDGTFVGMISQTAGIGEVLETPGVKYDVRKFAWVGRLTSNVQLFHAWHTAKVKSIEDAKKDPLVVAGTGPTSSSVVFPRIMNDLLHTKFQLIPGFQGAGSATLAMERGEVEAVVRPWAEIKAKSADWVRDKTIVPLVQFSLHRHPDLPDVPAVVDLAPNPEDRQLLALFASGSEVGNAIVAPPGVAPEIVAMHRAAFDAVMRDPELLADAAKAGLELDALDGTSLQKVLDEVFKVSPEVIARARHYSEGK